MLEVLDPEQHSHFRDHYLDLPFDLSKVLFICTANTLDTIPAAAARPDGRDPALRLHAGREARDREALPRAEAARGARPEEVARSRSRTARSSSSSREYTREAGVRNLERQIADDLPQGGDAGRARARPRRSRIDDGARARVARPAALLRRGAHAGPPTPGVATGLAVHRRSAATCSSSRRPPIRARAGCRITGQLGEVMQESAQARALVGPGARRASSASTAAWFAEHDVHIHVPAGAVPKDGPSAGVTMATAIASLVRGEPVSDDVGMTGEITLTGQVLPIGGIREKVLAAQRAGPEARDPAARERARPRRPAAGDARGARVRPGRRDRGGARARVRRRRPSSGDARHAALGAARPRRPHSERLRLFARIARGQTQERLRTRKDEPDGQDKGQALRHCRHRAAVRRARAARRRPARQPQGGVQRGAGGLRRAARRPQPHRRPRCARRPTRRSRRTSGRRSRSSGRPRTGSRARKTTAARNTMLLLAGITAGILFNPMTGPQTRKWLMDKVAGEGDRTTTRTRRPSTARPLRLASRCPSGAAALLTASWQQGAVVLGRDRGDERPLERAGLEAARARDVARAEQERARARRRRRQRHGRRPAATRGERRRPRAAARRAGTGTACTTPS